MNTKKYRKVLCGILLFSLLTPAIRSGAFADNEEEETTEAIENASGVTETPESTSSQIIFVVDEETDGIPYYEPVEPLETQQPNEPVPNIDTMNYSGKSITDIALSEYLYYGDFGKYNDWFYNDTERAMNSQWNTTFISWCAEQAGLIADATFPKSADAKALYHYMTEQNGFSAYSRQELESHLYNVVDGDLLFTTENTTGEKCVGIVVRSDELSFDVITGKDNALIMDSYSYEEINSYDKYEIVHVEYPDYEEGIYLFLINQLKFSYGGAIGVLANIYAEASDFSPMSIEIGNNEGFGICQWSGDRKISLYKFASDNGYDIRTLETQLLFLKYELDLNPYYTNMIEILRSCDNSPEGAAYAARVWCSTFEMPANMDYQCDRRSAIASNILFERHL